MTRTGVRIAALGVAIAWWVLSGLGYLRRGRPVVLCYHGVRREQRRGFRQQMRAVRGRVVPAGDRRRRWGRPRLGITFDDAFANLLDHALPVTTRYGIPVTIFAVTGNLGATPRWLMRPGHPEAFERTMTATEIRRADCLRGVTFGAHGATHRSLVSLSPLVARGELLASKNCLEGIVGRRVIAFAFPYGDWTPSLGRAARQTGYQRTFVLESTPRGRSGRGVVYRTLMSPDAWPLEFRLAADGAYAWRAWVRRARAAGSWPGAAKLGPHRGYR